MTYIEAVNWLYAAVPNFQRDGGGKNYKIGLEGPEALWNYLGRPSDAIPTIHIAGTNGKGSSAHLISAGLQSMGCKVGVFSSPHLFNFRERAKSGLRWFLNHLWPNGYRNIEAKLNKKEIAFSN